MSAVLVEDTIKPEAVGGETIRFKLPHLVSPAKPKDILQGVASVGLINTFGWDTVFGIRMPDVNSAIRKYASSPTEFTQSKVYGGLTASARGAFGAWQLTQGGSGPVVFMSVPISSGNLNYNSVDYPYTNAVATISIHLEFVPQPPVGLKGFLQAADKKPTGRPHLLRVKSPKSYLKEAKATVPVSRVKLGSEPHLQATKAVTVEDLSYQGDPFVGVFLRDLLEVWFAGHMESFEHTFAVVDLDATAAEAAWQWLKPTTVSYAYVQPAGTPPDEECVFGVLCMSGGRSAMGLSQQIDANIIPAGTRAGFLISAERYIDKVLAPSIAQAFSGASTADFVITPGTAQLTNINALNMHPLKGYVPHVAPRDFTVEIKAGELQISLKKAHVKISSGIDLYLNYTVHANVQLVTRSTGEKALHLYDTLDVEYDHEVQVDKWVTISEVAAGLIAGVLFAGIGNVAGKAATRACVNAGKVAEESLCARFIKWIIAALFGLVGGAAGTISTIIEANAEKNAEKLPAFDPFASEAISTTQWPGSSSQTVLQSVCFNGGLQMGLDPRFVE